MLYPGPALADRILDQLDAGTVGDIGQGEVNHQHASARIKSDMTRAADGAYGIAIKTTSMLYPHQSA